MIQMQTIAGEASHWVVLPIPELGTACRVEIATSAPVDAAIVSGPKLNEFLAAEYGDDVPGIEWKTSKCQDEFLLRGTSDPRFLLVWNADNDQPVHLAYRAELQEES